MGDAQRTFETALAGAVVGEFWDGERPVPIRVRLPRRARRPPSVGDPMPTRAGRHVPLRDLGPRRTGRASINHEDNPAARWP